MFGSNSGGVNPTGASFVAVSSAAAALIVRDVNLIGLGPVKVSDDDCFHGAAMRSPDFAAERAVGVKREAWVAIAMKGVVCGVVVASGVCVCV